jgi:hypothetical protein
MLADGELLAGDVPPGDDVAFPEGVRLADGVTLADAVPLGDNVTLPDGGPLPDGLTLADGVTLPDCVTLTDPFGDGVRLTEGVTLTDALGAAVADVPEGAGIGAVSGTADYAEYLPHRERTTYDGREHGQDLADSPDVDCGKDRTGRPCGHDCSPAIHCRFFSIRAVLPLWTITARRRPDFLPLSGRLSP